LRHHHSVEATEDGDRMEQFFDVNLIPRIQSMEKKTTSFRIERRERDRREKGRDHGRHPEVGRPVKPEDETIGRKIDITI
jgi:hypothetical protein